MARIFGSRLVSKNPPTNYSYMKLDQIYHGDNLWYMEDMIKMYPNGMIDLIYIDPPFGTQSLWSSKAWNEPVQEMAFYDVFGGGVSGYINFMVPRLRLMHKLLKPTGSLFVHLDWRMSHYIKIELDKIFGVKNPSAKNTNFVNEIVWCYKGGGPFKRYLSKKHDIILWYSKKKKKHTYNKQYVPYSEGTLQRGYKEV